MKTYVLALALGLMMMAGKARAQASPDWKLAVRDELISRREDLFLRALHEENEEFIFSSKVRRYFAIDAAGHETLLRSEILFERQGNFIVWQGKPTENVSYTVTFTEGGLGGLIISYSHSTDASYNVDGTALVNSEGVVTSTFSCGPASCGFESSRVPQLSANSKRK